MNFPLVLFFQFYYRHPHGYPPSHYPGGMPPPVHMGRGYPPPPGAPSQQSQGYPQGYPPVSHHGHPQHRAHPGMESQSGNPAGRGQPMGQPGFNQKQILPKPVSTFNYLKTELT